MTKVEHPDFERSHFAIECRFTGDNPEQVAFLSQLIAELYSVANAADALSVRAGKNPKRPGIVDLPESSLTRLDIALAGLRDLHDLVPVEMRLTLASCPPAPKAKIIPYRARKTKPDKENR